MELAYGLKTFYPQCRFELDVMWPVGEDIACRSVKGLAGEGNSRWPVEGLDVEG